jgi:hypothetical protein
VQFQATGEGGFAKAMEHVSAVEYATWGDAWRAWKAGEASHVSPFRTEAMKPEEWRLTDQGVIARGELDGTNPQTGPETVFDFIFKRGFFGPGYWSRLAISNPARLDKAIINEQMQNTGQAWQVLPRPPLSGAGLLVKLRKIERPAGSQAVNLTNWGEGADAFAAAFAKMLGPMFDAMSKNQQANASLSASPPSAKTGEREGNGGTGSGRPATNGEIMADSPSPEPAKSLMGAIDALLSFIEECTKVREDPKGALGRFILRSEMERFRELDELVFRLAFKAGLLAALPQKDDVEHELLGTQREELDRPRVMFEGKTNLPGDWAEGVFMPVWEGRWKADVLALRALAADKEQGERKMEPSQTTVSPQGKRFRVALSFPGEHREFIAEVATSLASSLGQDRVFYDRYYEAALARPNLDTYLQQIYHDDSDLIAVFLCAEYEQKDWCGLEWRAIRDLIKKRNSAAIMPFRFDNTLVPGLFSIDGYVDIGQRSAGDVASLILQRLRNNDQQT